MQNIDGIILTVRMEPSIRVEQLLHFPRKGHIHCICVVKMLHEIMEHGAEYISLIKQIQLLQPQMPQLHGKMQTLILHFWHQI